MTAMQTAVVPSLLQTAVPLYPGFCAFDKRLGISGAFSLILDAAAAHSEKIGTGCVDMAKKRLFWLMVRSKIRFYKRPEMMQSVTLATWPAAPGRLFCDRFYTACGEDGALFFEARNEWAVLDTETGKPTRTEHIYGDTLFPLAASVLPEPFLRMTDDFTEKEAVAAYTVRPSDIDFGGHVNHVLYLRMLTDTVPLSEQAKHPPKEVEVQYLAPCFEGETLTVFRRMESGTATLFAIRKPNGQTALLARLETVPEE